MIRAPGLSWTNGDVAFRFRATGSTGLSRRVVVGRLGAGSREVGVLAAGLSKTSCFRLAGIEGAARGGDAEGTAGGS